MKLRTKEQQLQNQDRRNFLRGTGLMVVGVVVAYVVAKVKPVQEAAPSTIQFKISAQGKK